jgi:hypothetical protein
MRTRWPEQGSGRFAKNSSEVPSSDRRRILGESRQATGSVKAGFIHILEER